MRVCCLVILACSLVSVPVMAQERGAPPAGTLRAGRNQNLQVLPKDIPQPELAQMMQGFAQGLGVQCTYCHAPAPAPEGGGRFGGGGGRDAGGPPHSTSRPISFPRRRRRAR